MYLLVLFFPAFSAFLTGFFGSAFGKNGVRVLNITSMVCTFMVSIFIFFEVCLHHYTTYICLYPLIICDVLTLNVEFLFDSITATMLLVVSFVSLLVHIYSLDYMSEDPHHIRFMTYLSLFTFFMFVLLTSGNFVQLFFGWEGVGLSSYLLINFWFTRTQANISGLKALVINRFGDFGVYAAILLIFFTFKSFNFYVVFSSCYKFTAYSIDFFGNSFNVLTLIGIFLFIGAIGKSAQIGLHVWLPDAMEGPTPVSALIHAATMVTAGIFLIIRCSPLLEYAPTVLIFITFIGSLTAFFAATIGLVQTDLKKIIAYSTCSQLGYMVFSCGISNYSAGFFHLINHAFFKALLFLCAGSIIHALSNEQDIRKMGGLAKILPVTYVMMLIGSLALLGFPYLTGFYSKDLILELSFSKITVSSLFAYWLGTLSVFFTAFYSLRLLHLAFWGNIPGGFRQVYMLAHEAPLFMQYSLLPLALGSIFWGYLMKDFFVGVGSCNLQSSIFVLPQNYNIVDAEFLPLFIKLIPFFFSMCGIGFSFILFYFVSSINILTLSTRFFSLFSFFSKKWYFDLLYNQYFVRSFFFFSYRVTFKYVDRGILEFFGPLGIVRSLNNLSSGLTNLQSGFVFQYIYTFIFTICLFCFLFFFNAVIVDFQFILHWDFLLPLVMYLIIVLFFSKKVTIGSSCEE